MVKLSEDEMEDFRKCKEKLKSIEDQLPSLWIIFSESEQLRIRNRLRGINILIKYIDECSENLSPAQYDFAANSLIMFAEEITEIICFQSTP
jgi:hypothetical protein